MVDFGRGGCGRGHSVAGAMTFTFLVRGRVSCAAALDSFIRLSGRSGNGVRRVTETRPDCGRQVREYSANGFLECAAGVAAAFGEKEEVGGVAVEAAGQLDL